MDNVVAELGRHERIGHSRYVNAHYGPHSWYGLHVPRDTTHHRGARCFGNNFNSCPSTPCYCRHTEHGVWSCRFSNEQHDHRFMGCANSASAHWLQGGNCGNRCWKHGYNGHIQRCLGNMEWSSCSSKHVCNGNVCSRVSKQCRCYWYCSSNVAHCRFVVLRQGHAIECERRRFAVLYIGDANGNTCSTRNHISCCSR